MGVSGVATNTAGKKEHYKGLWRLVSGGQSLPISSATSLSSVPHRIMEGQVVRKSQEQMLDSGCHRLHGEETRPHTQYPGCKHQV